MKRQSANQKLTATLEAFLAAAFYAVNTPCSKLLLTRVEPTMMAAFLYLGAGIGIGIPFWLTRSKRPGTPLSRNDLPYTVGMILLDILAPILLMFGLLDTTSSSAALLNNFEIVATSVIALVIFKEAISPQLWTAIGLVTLASALLSVEDLSGFQFSFGSLLVLLAASCWGLENNCTRMISGKDTFEIVTLKGIFSGLGSLVVALLMGERLPGAADALLVLLLGFVAYGLSIFCYIRAQRTLGAAKTSAYYAAAPFLGAGLSFLLLREPLSLRYGLALLVMLAGSALIVADTLLLRHSHLHTHTYTHTHDGVTHTHTYTHAHPHIHLAAGGHHTHSHTHLIPEHHHTHHPMPPAQHPL